MRHTGVDPRGDLLFDHLADIDAGWGAAEIQEGDGEVLVFGVGDLVHIQGGVDRISGDAADEGDQRRGGCHGKTANAGCFGDDAVADIGAGIFFGEAGEVERLDDWGWGGEPAVAQPADADAEIGAVARHDGDDRAAFHIFAGGGHRLAARHHRVEDAQARYRPGI